MRHRLLPLLLFLLAPLSFAQTGYVTMTASKLMDQSGGGGPISHATACFQLVNPQGLPIGVHIGGTAGGQAAPRKTCGPVNNGALVGTWQPSDPTAAGTNLVPDPVFTPGWATWSNPGSAWVESAQSIGVGNAASGLQQYSLSAAIAVTPGQTYTFSAYIDAFYATGAAPTFVLTNSGSSLAYATLTAVPGTRAVYYAQWTVPAGVTQVYVSPQTDATTIASGHAIYFSQPLLQLGSAQLVDTNLSNPQNPGYLLTITDDYTGGTVLGGPGSGYTTIQPQWTESSPMSCIAGVCNLDSYVPATTPGTFQTVGPVGPPPNIAIGTVTVLSAGSTPTISLAGTSPNYTINFGIPAGPAGTASSPGTLNQVQVNNGAGQLAATPMLVDSTGAATASSLYAGLTQVAPTGDLPATGPPYYISGSSFSTTTTSSASSGATTLNVASCGDFSTSSLNWQAGHQGVYAGPGTGGTLPSYIGTIVTCISNVLTVTPALYGTVANGAVVMHDETAGLQSLISDSASQHKTGRLPNGVYNVNGPLQDTSGANAILKVPTVSATSSSDQNFWQVVSLAGSPATSLSAAGGTIIRTLAPAGNLFGGYAAASGSGFNLPFTLVTLRLKDLHIEAYPDPGIVPVNAYNIANADFENVSVDSGCTNIGGTSYLGTSCPSPPTNTAGYAIIFPAGGNMAEDTASETEVQGFYNGYQISEHVNMGEAQCEVVANCVMLYGTTGTHGNHIGRILVQFSTNAFVVDTRTPNAGALQVDTLTGENVTNCWVPNSTTGWHGAIQYNSGMGSFCPTQIASSPGMQLVPLWYGNYPGSFNTNVTMDWRTRDWSYTATDTYHTWTLPAGDPSGMEHSVTNDGTTQLILSGSLATDFPAQVNPGNSLHFHYSPVDSHWHALGSSVSVLNLKQCGYTASFTLNATCGISIYTGTADATVTLPTVGATGVSTTGPATIFNNVNHVLTVSGGGYNIPTKLLGGQSLQLYMDTGTWYSLQQFHGALYGETPSLTSVSTSALYSPRLNSVYGTLSDITAVAATFTCSVNPVLTLEDCGTGTSCASPTALASITLTAANTLTAGTISSAPLTAAHYLAWSVTAGTCTALQISGSASY